MKEVRDSRSDPVTYTCTCDAGPDSGSVLLFYRYWSKHPKLSERHAKQATDLESLAQWHRELMQAGALTGKVRIAKEGYNITVAGAHLGITRYMAECRGHWSFDGLDANDSFFKPSLGCSCVFTSANIRVVAEITPMGVEGYVPAQWETVTDLSPEEFHQKLQEQKSALIDVRNHYESRIGYFIDPTSGEPAIRLNIRRFSQWPHYAMRHLNDLSNANNKQVLTYCTGGIRCEKAVRWMQEMVVQDPDVQIYTLRGGIAAYLDWINKEIQEGRKSPEDSYFLGRNFVFDGRGSIGQDGQSAPVSKCHVCENPSDSLGKCGSPTCHLILVLCASCQEKDPRCCDDCRSSSMDGLDLRSKQRKMCACEEAREEGLWGNKPSKIAKARASRKKNAKQVSDGSIAKDSH